MHGSGTPDTCVHVKGTNYNDCRGRNVLAERNYACDSEVEAYFGATDFDATGEDAFKAQLHKCVMATTLWLKGQVEIFRGSNSFGTLIWQLNENWPTGGWGLLEYGSSHGQKGQSIGGRWKPVMHLLKQALFQDVFATCGQRGECYIRNDSSESLSLVSIQLEIYDLASGEQTRESIVTLPLLLGNGHVGTSSAFDDIAVSPALSFEPLLPYRILSLSVVNLGLDRGPSCIYTGPKRKESHV